MNFERYRNLDFNDPGSWPAGAKAIAAAVVIALAVGAGWYFDWQDQQQQLKQAQAQEQGLRQDFETKQKRAANLEVYKEQLATMRESFGEMLRQLPSRAEVARLLVDISQTGLSSGLEFDLFKPQSPVQQEFYAELPVSIRVRGTYHEFAQFVSGVANLPRIVTLHDVGIEANRNDSENGPILAMELTARTYWYLDEEGEQ
ncbi:type 4a pilus biogenesis protein PilO [Arhodomonas sp. AD133]|uniref:type 4a pilus biogenesis protein PilO n=1 Tax=Arhodomonas sp. AD133 TaxID=3415009 RepID=UPI003EBE2848